MAKLTLDKLEKHLDAGYELHDFPVDEKKEFTAAAMYNLLASGLEAQAERWVAAHARLQEYAAVVSPTYVSEEEAATLREVLGKTSQLAAFADAQPGAAREAAKMLQDVVERVAAERESAVDAREAMKDRILGFGGPLLEDFAAAEKVYASLDFGELAMCVPASFYDAITAPFVDDDDSDKCWLICGGELYSPASAILVHLFWDDEIETFTPSEEHEDDDEPEEDEEPEEEPDEEE